MSTSKPSQAEEEYFAREDAEKKRKLALKEAKTLAASEREALQAQHAGHCPQCGHKMQQLTLQAVSVLRCFVCNGLFVGEQDLQKLKGSSGYWDRMLHFFVRRDYTITT